MSTPIQRFSSNSARIAGALGDALQQNGWQVLAPVAMRDHAFELDAGSSSNERMRRRRMAIVVVALPGGVGHSIG